MTRYFIGLMAPPEVQTHLRAFTEAIQARLPQHHPYNISWNHPADLHCTLLFIGPHEDPAQLVKQMQKIASQLAPPFLTIAGATHWLGRNSLALPVEGADHVGTTFVEQLRQESSDRWAGRRPFHGHITLGRVRPVPAAQDDPFTPDRVEPLSWRATDVQLVAGGGATLGKRYDVIAEAPFTG